jgi:ABC-type bacteriocin/lantibiotic exporter with double-glycine peptidase domain
MSGGGRSSSILAELGDGSLISVVPGLSDLILESGVVRLFAPKTEVLELGRVLDQLIIPLDGGLTLVQHSAAAPSREIGYLKKRQSLALGELLRGNPVGYAAVTEAATRVLFVAKENFEALMRREPDVHHYLKLITFSSGVRAFKNFLSDRGVNQRDAIRIIRSISDRSEIFEEGAEVVASSPSLAFIRNGMLRVEEAGTSSWSVTLGEGSWYGGEALVEPYRLSYKVTVIQKAEIHFCNLDRLREQLRSLGLIEEVYNDPCIARGTETRPQTQDLPPTELPGEEIPITHGALRHVATVWVADAQKARSDGESYLACLFNICKMMDVQINLSIVETFFALDRKVSYLRLAEMLETFGLHTHYLKPALKTLDRQAFPALVMIGPRLMILMRADCRRKRLYLHDPVRGLIMMRFKGVEGFWDLAMLSISRLNFEKSAEAEATQNQARAGKKAGIRKRISTSALLGYVWQYKNILANVLVLNLMAIGVSMTTPLFSQHILDEVLALRDMVTLWTCVLGLLIALIVSTLIKMAADYSLNEFAVRYDQTLSTFFYRHALSLPGENYSKQKTGDILSRINAITHIRRLLSGSAIEAVVTSLSVGVYFIILSEYSISIAALTTVILMVIGVAQVLYRKTLITNYRQFFEADTRARSLLTEQISSIATIKATGSEKEMRARWEGVQLETIKVQKKSRLAAALLQVIMTFVVGGAQLLSVWVAARMAIARELTPGQVLAVSLYVGQMMAPAGTLAGLIMNSAMFEVSLQRLEELLAMRSEQDGPQSSKMRHSFPFRGKVRLDNVGFRYGKDGPEILKNLSLTIYPKQVVAIVGRSGCGKSTLANLIAANLKPSSGRIFFDDFDGQFLSVGSLRRQIGFVMQHNELFSGTLMDNIAFADDTPDVKNVFKATISAGADFILNLPAGLEYYLGVSGVGLSGGEKQRVSVARTFYRNTKILILDEATSALDSITEKTLNNNLREIVRDRTVIIIAHRLSTIRSADRIVVMDEGRIVEEGTHADLLEKNGFYSRLFQSQMKLAEA